MQLLEVYTPGIDVYVRYKVLDPLDVEAFVDAHKTEDRDVYKRDVMELVVYNLRTDVLDSLRSIDKDKARLCLDSIYNGCVMLNPGLDVDSWLRISVTNADSVVAPPVSPPKEPPAKQTTAKKTETQTKPKPRKSRRITRAKFRGLEPHLKDRIVGQDEAIEAVTSALKRSIIGLSDDERPLGTFLFAGASGIGKTHLAKELHSYLYGTDYDLVRIDCGEYQHKHENQKLLGAPPGYVGYDEGGQLTSKIKAHPYTVVLLDEVEKAHPDLWNTFLRIFDEGMVTDGSGEEVSFRNTIIIMTTNLGNKEVVSDSINVGIGFGKNIHVDIKNSVLPPRDQVIKYAEKAIRKSFRPEFLNRIDKTIVFNHLSNSNMNAIARLELDRLAAKLKKKGMTLDYGDEVLERMVEEGVNPVEGVRGLSKVRRDHIEDRVADKLMASSRWPRGTAVTIYLDGTDFDVAVKRPVKKKAQEKKNANT